MNDIGVILITTAISSGICCLIWLNSHFTLRCRSIALEAIRDYNIDQYMILGRDKWERLKYENVLRKYTYTWFSPIKDYKSVIKPKYQVILADYYENAKKFHEDEKPNKYPELEDK